MKIGFVLDDTLDSTDGVQQYVLTLGRWLTQNGHEVHYLVGQTARNDIAHIHSLARNKAVRFNGNTMTIPLPTRTAAIKHLLAVEQFDVLHVQMPYSPFMAAKVICNAPVRTAVVGTFHIMPFGRMQRYGAWLLQHLLWRSMRRLDAIYSVSEPAKVFAQSLGIASSVIPNTIVIKDFSDNKKASENKGQFTIVYLGRLVERKGCIQLLRAVERLYKRKTIDNLHVIIGGTGPQASYLQQWVQDHGIGGIVSFQGYVAEADKAKFLSKANIAVFPSYAGESFGIVLLEAMASKAEVVLGGDNPGYRSVLSTVSESLFDPYNVAELALKIENLNLNQALRAKIHQKQQKLVREFDIEVVGTKLVCEYERLVAKHQGSQHNT